MPKAMQIRLGIAGVSRVRSGFKSAGDDADVFTGRVDKLTSALERLAQQMGQMAKLPAIVTSVPSVRGGGGAPRVGGGGSNRSSGGSLARLLEAQQGVKSDPTDFDSQVRLLRAQRRFDRDSDMLKPRTFGDKLNDALLSSRVGMSGGTPQLMPLVGRVLPLFGEGLTKLIGPLGLAYAGLSGLAHISQASAENLQRLGTAQTLSGGTAREIAGLTSYGVAPDQLAGLAQRFRERISLENGDMFAISAAQQLGIKPTMGRNYGPQDEAKTLLEGMEKLRAIRGDTSRQTRLARQLGMDDILPQLNVSDGLWAQMRAGAERRAQLTQGVAQAGNDLEATRTLRNNAFQDATAPLGRAAMGLEQGANSQLARLFQGKFGEFFQVGMGGEESLKKGGDTQKEATEKNTRAVEKLSRVVEEGLNGAGPRGQRAVRLTGPSLAEAVRANAFLHRAWDTSGR